MIFIIKTNSFIFCLHIMPVSELLFFPCSALYFNGFSMVSGWYLDGFAIACDHSKTIQIPSEDQPYAILEQSRTWAVLYCPRKKACFADAYKKRGGWAGGIEAIWRLDPGTVSPDFDDQGRFSGYGSCLLYWSCI